MPQDVAPDTAMQTPLTWWEVSLQVPQEAVEAVAELFYRYGHGGVAIEEPFQQPPDLEEAVIDAQGLVVVKTYLPAGRESRQRRARLERDLWHLSRLMPLGPLTVRNIQEEDWAQAWKEHFPVHRVGQGTVIVPCWRQYAPKEGERIILLDPGLAFGTGLHPTTRMCLEFLEELPLVGAEVLDLGTGSGILGIAAVKGGAQSVLALDSDPLAVRAALQNAQRNGVGSELKVALGTLEGADLATVSPSVPRYSFLGRFYLILANLTARTLSHLAPALLQALASGGMVVASGLLAAAAPEVTARFQAAGARPTATRFQGDWCALLFQKAT